MHRGRRVGQQPHDVSEAQSSPALGYYHDAHQLASAPPDFYPAAVAPNASATAEGLFPFYFDTNVAANDISWSADSHGIPFPGPPLPDLPHRFALAHELQALAPHGSMNMIAATAGPSNPFNEPISFHQLSSPDIAAFQQTDLHTQHVAGPVFRQPITSRIPGLARGHSQPYEQVAQIGAEASTFYPTATQSASASHNSRGPDSIEVERKAPRKGLQRSSRRREPREPRDGRPSLGKQDKISQAREVGACWRCKRYKKPCNGADVCDACLTSGFRVWPSTLGCVRGNLDSFAEIVLPPHIGELLKPYSSFTRMQRPAWRQLISLDDVQRLTHYNPTARIDKWTQLSDKTVATRIYGAELVQLLNIIAEYQMRQTKENSLLDAGCTLLDGSCDIYSFFIETGTEFSTNWAGTAPLNIVEAVLRTQRALARSLRLLLNSCLSGRRSDWLPCILGASLCNISILLLLDAAFVMPVDARDKIWPNIAETCTELRERLYQAVLDLLSVSSSSMKPLSMSCWTQESDAEMDQHESGQRGIGRNEVDAAPSLKDPPAPANLMLWSAASSTSSPSSVFSGLTTPGTPDVAPFPNSLSATETIGSSHLAFTMTTNSRVTSTPALSYTSVPSYAEASSISMTPYPSTISHMHLHAGNTSPSNSSVLPSSESDPRTSKMQYAASTPIVPPGPSAEIDTTTISSRPRNPEGLRLLNHDTAAYDGFSALQQWRTVHSAALESGVRMFANDPFTIANTPSIAALYKIFS